MKTRIALFMLVALGAPVGDGAAQSPVQSFDSLPTVVRSGAAVLVQLDDGRRMSGKIVSLTDDQIEIRRRRGLFRSERLSLPEVSVRRIEKRDSTWNGELLGFAGGVAAAWFRCKIARDESAAWSCLWWVPIAPAAGTLIGGAIDSANRQPLYLAPGSRVQLRPLRRGAAIATTIGF